MIDNCHLVVSDRGNTTQMGEVVLIVACPLLDEHPPRSTLVVPAAVRGVQIPLPDTRRRYWPGSWVDGVPTPPRSRVAGVFGHLGSFFSLRPEKFGTRGYFLEWEDDRLSPGEAIKGGMCYSRGDVFFWGRRQMFQ